MAGPGLILALIQLRAIGRDESCKSGVRTFGDYHTILGELLVVRPITSQPHGSRSCDFGGDCKYQPQKVNSLLFANR